MPQILILGTRGVPGAHGGFETFAERLSLYLAEKGWSVGVYCQEETGAGSGAIYEAPWRGVTRIVVPVGRVGPAATLEFDWRCIGDALSRPGQLLIFGYNTAFFDFRLRLAKRRMVVNMDGLEWKRAKWSLPVRGWFWLNERAATRLGARLIADHPEIERRLRRIAPGADVTMIPYGADRIESAPTGPIEAIGLESDRYFYSVCRIEPENSVLEIVQAFSTKKRNRKLVVLGDVKPKTHPYHRAIFDTANDQVIFPGAIYDQNILASLRFHARAYCHGHRVGGTNPSLVESLAAGNAIIARDNEFNRWTAGSHQYYFHDYQSCVEQFDALDSASPDENLERARSAAIARYRSGLTWEHVLGQYEALLSE